MGILTGGYEISRKRQKALEKKLFFKFQMAKLNFQNLNKNGNLWPKRQQKIFTVSFIFSNYFWHGSGTFQV